jgi:hypothetical protein
MKTILILAAIMAAATCVRAQNYGFDIYLRGGVGVPDAPDLYAQNWQLGPHTGTGFEFTLSQRISVGGGIEYARNSIKKDRLLDGTIVSDARITGGVLDMFSLAMFLNYRMLGKVMNTFPFIIMDAGVTHFRINNQTIQRADISQTVLGSSETAFRAAWGLGIDIPLSSTVAFTCGGKYVFIFAREDRRGYLPIDGGFKFVF